eukprot:scaffold5037_cov114-Isochrysis_galbana.AAC.9
MLHRDELFALSVQVPVALHRVPRPCGGLSSVVPRAPHYENKTKKNLARAARRPRREKALRRLRRFVENPEIATVRAVTGLRHLSLSLKGQSSRRKLIFPDLATRKPAGGKTLSGGAIQGIP